MAANAADPPKPALTVAVYDFTADADAASYATKLTTLVTVNLTTETNLALVERAELTKALREQAFGISGMVSSDAAAKVGQITGAKILVAGQVMKISDNHLVVVADIIGTETGRLFAEKAEGAADNLLGLTDELSRKIAQTITVHTANLTAPAQESSAQRLARIMKSIPGTNRPSVSLSIHWTRQGKVHDSTTALGEFGTVLLKAGFPVVDANSEQKPDIEIIGTEDSSVGPRQGDLYSYSDAMDFKVQDRRTGRIIAVEHQLGTATDGTVVGANTAAQVNAVDAVCERILPLLAKQHYEP